MENTFWIWYPGDFELYHAMKQNFSRVERGFGWPAFWKSEGFRNRVALRRVYELEQETSFTVFSNAVGHVLVTWENGEKKYPFGKKITVGPGKVRISIHAGCVEAFPCAYVQGEVIHSDKTWTAEDYSQPAVPVGVCKYFTKPEQNPTVWEYTEKECRPVKITEVNGGVLAEFETELTAAVYVNDKRKETGDNQERCITAEENNAGKNAAGNAECGLEVYCGESEDEALDLEHCYYSWQPDPVTKRCPCCAVRFAFIPDCKAEDVEITAFYQYVDFPKRASFKSNDEKLNKIWDVAEHSFRLCSGIFFLDGVKRDKWIWSGDAYQSFFVNQYLLADPDIDQRTLLALRGNDPMTRHINTIMDYSLFWVLGVLYHYEVYGDLEFVRQVYPKMCSLMEFCEEQLDENGFLVGRENDWIYIDWADMDKTGALCAEQMLFAACWQAMAKVSDALGEKNPEYTEKYEKLISQIRKFYWDQEKGAFIDSFESGKRNVTRHANIFAILFHIATAEEQEKILENVIKNDAIPAITTPYFNFFELDMLCQTGNLEFVLNKMRSYWGGMLERGAVTFWEEFDPKAPVEEQYDMYGDRFGKSLCHAWAASPIYFLAKYFMGLKFTAVGGKAFELEPHTEFFDSFDCTLPVADGQVHLTWDGKDLKVETNAEGGVLKVNGECRKLETSL